MNIAREKSTPSLNSLQARRDEKNRQVCLITGGTK